VLLVRAIGSHEFLMAYLYENHTGKDRFTLSKGSFDDVAELYIIEGHGMFKSSRSRRVFIGPEYHVPSNHKALFGDRIEVME
jgi:hypothetical protein